MQNKIDLSSEPEKLFLNPWQDPGIESLYQPPFFWRTIPTARIRGFSASAHQEINRKIGRVIRTAERTQGFEKAIEYAAVPVVLEEAGFRKSFKQAMGKLLLSGASSNRLLNRFRWENQDGRGGADEALERYFQNCRDADTNFELPALSALLEPDTAFAVECRNTFNFYHFLVESLCQLTVLDGLNFQGPIYFHFPNAPERQRPFAQRFVEALFPEFAGRVFFEQTPRDYKRVVTAYDMMGGHFQAPANALAEMDQHLPRELRDSGGAVALSSRPALAVNSVSSMLLALRERALKTIELHDFSHLPKRFFVGRDDRKSRSRHMEGEDALFEHLALFGFEYVVFESLPPLEQIALMARAEMMVSYHGAGFANMLFAGAQTHVIEIGTLQTARQRWGDFWPLAHAAGCKYTTFFVDMKTKNPLVEPDFQKEGLVPASISVEATGQIMAFIVSLFGQYPELKSRETVVELVRELLQVGAVEQALNVAEKHEQMLERSADLCLLKADCHKELNEPKSELVALDLAHKADPKRWQTLVRIIWCANRCDRPQVIRWALERLKVRFPERHDAFVSNHEWVRFVA